VARLQTFALGAVFALDTVYGLERGRAYIGSVRWAMPAWQARLEEVWGNDDSDTIHPLGNVFDVSYHPIGWTRVALVGRYQSTSQIDEYVPTQLTTIGLKITAAPWLGVDLNYGFGPGRGYTEQGRNLSIGLHAAFKF
jgi:hypothetical protein